ncbi:GNAT family N-acetyltransferase [Proteiniclasticum sp.]|uniref:GNAT family N-acetyltransferase n=1 Tax=Proteiniclasticum sp. TaxID=2053595 RepID=UPI0028967115|nr:GNAT family N-acetyltransferase [Proteiniclasticum sp.]
MRLTCEKYKKNYIQEIKNLLTEDEFVRKDTLGCLEDFPECAVVVKSDHDTVAIGVYTGRTKRTSMTFTVSPGRRNEGIGSFLLSALENEMLEYGVEEIICDYKVDDSIRAFLLKRGYENWFRSNHMIYSGDKFDVSQISVSDYSDKDYDAVQKILSEAIHRMRLSVGLESVPSEPSEEEKETYQKKSEDIFVLRENEEIAAAVMVENNEIDKLAVSVNKQGMGYGKELLAYTVNRLKERGFSEISLWVVESNPAKILYEKAGFSLNRQHEFIRKKLI